MSDCILKNLHTQVNSLFDIYLYVNLLFQSEPHEKFAARNILNYNIQMKKWMTRIKNLFNIYFLCGFTDLVLTV